MSVAFLFPGQGVLRERDLESWYSGSECARGLLEAAARSLGTTFAEILRISRARILPTEILEPVHVALCLGVERELTARGIRPAVVAGHSLGEIAACASAGVFDAEAAVALSAERGRLMAREARKRPGGMLLIDAVTRDEVDEAVAFASRDGIAALGAHNAPRQWVISGEWAALRRLATRYATTTIPVDGAWHCAILADAVDEFREAVRQARPRPPGVALVSNREGEAVATADVIPDLLAEQFTHPIEWVRTLETIAALGASDWVTIGPGRLLRGLVRLGVTAPVRLYSTDTPEDLPRAVEVLVP